VTAAQRAGVAQAIAEAERGTSGRIAVWELPDTRLDALARARREFTNIGLDKHAPRNGALVVVAPAARQFAIVGDRGLHERVGPEFWNDVVRESAASFADGGVYDGVRTAVRRLGEALQTHFPQRDPA
jgi:uncharacterized membrane protein